MVRSGLTKGTSFRDSICQFQPNLYGTSMKIAMRLLGAGIALGFLTGCGPAASDAGDETSTQAEAAAGPKGSDWLLFRGDSNMLGVTEESLKMPLELVWTVETDGPVSATAVIADGRVYVGSLGGLFYCINLADGEVLWTFETELGMEGPACVVGDLVCFGDSEGYVFALNRKTGEQVWKYETEDAIVGGLNYFKSKTGKTLIIVGSDDFYLHAVDSETGEGVWKVETENYIKGAPSVVQEQGVCVFGGCDEVLRLVDADTGDLVKTVEIGAYMANSSAVRDGIAYIAHYGGNVLAVDLDSGDTIWTYDGDGAEFVASPAVTKDAVYVGAGDKLFRAIDRETGELLWDFPSRRSFDSSPVASPELVIVGSDDGRLYVLDKESGEEVWSYDTGKSINASPAVSNGYVVISTHNREGAIFCFKSAGNE